MLTSFTIALICAELLAVCAMWTDVRFWKIPNKLTVPFFIAALIFYTIAGAVYGGLFAGSIGNGLLTAISWLGFSLGGFAVGFGILFILFQINATGGGDVKLMGAIGAWLGAELTLYVLFAATVGAAVISMAVIGKSLMFGGFGKTKKRYFQKTDAKKIRKKGETLEEAEQRAKSRRKVVPFGLPIAIAVLLCLILRFASPEMLLDIWGGWTQ